MPLTKIQTQNIKEGAVTTAILSNTATAAFATSASVAEFASALAPKVASVNIANSSFAVLDDTAVNVGGGYIVITGANFAEGATVLIDTTSATSVARVNSTTLNVQVPTKSAATYNIFVVNPDGGTGIRVSGLTYSGFPSWVTTSPLDYQVNGRAFSLNFSATGASSYSVAAGSTLPAGATLLANGYFYGTVTVESDTVYSFDIVATDTELQDSPKTFGITLTLGPSQSLWTWGTGAGGVLGRNSVANLGAPGQLGTDTNWADADYCIGIKTNGTLWSWGPTKPDGRDTDTIVRSSPVQVGSDNGWKEVISGGNDVVLALKTNGTLWAWGENLYGQLGLNDNHDRSSPVQIGGDSNWSSFSTGFYVSGAIKTNGTLWMWGQESSGSLGQNVAFTGGLGISRSSPVQVGTGTNWSKISTGRDVETFAIKTDGTLWAWGNNNLGQLGTNNRINRSSPVQVGAGTNWKDVSGGQEAGQPHRLATKTDGTLWAWGNNVGGQLGLNVSTPNYRSSPVQVGVLTNWDKVFAGENGSSFAIKTNGTLWSWGVAGSKLGIGASLNVSSPTQVGVLTNWYKITTGINASVGLTRD
jgi:alpha-tubulin suppressor-like RCC1 family protein